MRLPALSIALGALSLPAQAGEWDARLAVGADVRLFVEEPAYESQFEGAQPSLILEPELRWESEDRRHQLLFQPYARIDGQDDERTHADLREGYYRYVGDGYDVTVGAVKVFWGVTESRHLVDIINQTDAVEDIDEEDKLGQPMVKLALFRDFGQVELFYLPYFRERTFPGVEGRLRPPLLVETDNAIFTDDRDEWSPSFAARYSNYFGAFDVSLSAFRGTSREPRLVENIALVPATAPPRPGYALIPSGSEPGVLGELSFAPAYDRITQVGGTVQYTTGSWAIKGEAMVREGQGDTFGALVAGFERTFFGITDGGADLGILAEIQLDGRDEFAPPTPADKDIFLGGRYALNDIQDTSILAGTITDLEDGSTAGLIEGERRFGNSWTGSLEARFFLGVDDGNLLSAYEQDSHLTLRITRYF